MKETLQQIVNGFKKYKTVKRKGKLNTKGEIEVFQFCRVCETRDGHKDDCPYWLAVMANRYFNE